MSLGHRRLPLADTASLRIPFSVLASPQVVLTKKGDFIQVFRLEGLPFETLGNEEINAAHERLNALLRNLSSPQVALWSHLVRTPFVLGATSDQGESFARRLAFAYDDRLRRQALFSNTHYLSVIYRAPLALRGSSWRGGNTSRSEASIGEGLATCEKLRVMILASFDSYGVRQLDNARSDGRWRSEVLGFLATLLNTEAEPIPLPRGPLDQHLFARRVLIGSETLEYRSATRTRYGCFLGLKEYPTPTCPGMLNALLALPTSLVLTQSFSYLSKSSAQGLLQRQYHRMRNAADLASSQTEALTQALDELSGNEFSMGDHHWSLQILSPTSGPDTPAAAVHAALQEDVATVRGVLADASVLSVREDLALEAAFWAQQPGQFALRPRTAPITSRNFAALCPWHTFPEGRAAGNHWGKATAVLRTRASGPYHFSLHGTQGSPGAAADVGHTFICGPTGSGKTVLIGFLLAQLHARGIAQVALDKDRGLEILIRSLDGTYLALRNGVPTGLNPLQLDATPENVEFLSQWLRILVFEAGRPLTSRQNSDLDQALRGVLSLPSRQRRLSRLTEFLDPTDLEGPYARLAGWCERTGGERSWAFDCVVDEVAPTLASNPLIGIDVTDFLKHDLIRAPLTLYLLYLVRSLLKGRPFVCWLDEFGRLLSDDAFRRFSEEGPNTWRKLNGVMCLATQGTRDVLQSSTSRTIVEQTPTKIFFPNPQADRADHIEGFGLTEREFELISKGLTVGSRQFLVRQNGVSVVCELDLGGLHGELDVLSGRLSNVQRMQRLRKTRGSPSSHWLDAFLCGDDADEE